MTLSVPQPPRLQMTPPGAEPICIATACGSHHKARPELMQENSRCSCIFPIYNWAGAMREMYTGILTFGQVGSVCGTVIGSAHAGCAMAGKT